MGLLSTDNKPWGISLRDAYKKISEWYYLNVDLALQRNDDYGLGSADLIYVLTPTITDLEIRAILGEVIYGYLEWGYHYSNGEFKMGAYAHAALESAGLGWQFTSAEIDLLKSSKLWKYLWISRP